MDVLNNRNFNDRNYYSGEEKTVHSARTQTVINVQSHYLQTVWGVLFIFRSVPPLVKCENEAKGEGGGG